MTTIFGRPVTGEILDTDTHRVEQWQPDIFLQLLDAVLEQHNVHSVRWTQYTPYFNDGEPCIFGINEIYVKMLSGYEDEGDYGDGYIGEYTMRDYSNRYKLALFKVEFADVGQALLDLQSSIAHFEDFLKESFGDHARVTATREGFDVEFYNHD